MKMLVEGIFRNEETVQISPCVVFLLLRLNYFWTGTVFFFFLQCSTVCFHFDKHAKCKLLAVILPCKSVPSEVDIACVYENLGVDMFYLIELVY